MIRIRRMNTRRDARIRPSAVLVAVSLAMTAPAVAAAQARPAAAECPAALSPPTVSNPWSATRTVLIPGGVQTLTMCWYAPGLPAPGALEHQLLVLPGSTLTKLVDGIRSLPQTAPGSQTGPPTNCPADFGVNVALLATYRQHAPVELLLDKTGCPSVTNGYLTGSFQGGETRRGAALISELDRLMPWPEAPPAASSPPSTPTR
jgi:hypothetical protein